MGTDKERHNWILNTLLDIMLRYIDRFHGFGAVSQYNSSEANFGPMTHYKLMHDCISGAVKYAVLEMADNYQEPIDLVFAKQEHVPEGLIRRYLDVYDYGPAEGRIKSFTTARPIDVRPLQAADLLAYEMARAQRSGRSARYPFNRIVAGAKAKGAPMTIYWGPIRSSTIVIS